MSTRIAIVGMGASGQAAAKLALAQGAKVATFDDRKNAPTVEGTTSYYGIDATQMLCVHDLIVISPGIPLAHPMFDAAKSKCIPILSELAFAAQYINIPVLAITGTNGKSSTTWFTAQFLEQAGKNPFVGGNFGTALSELVLHPYSADGKPYDIAVVEVSSYQMECPGEFKPSAGVILNLTPDHLARHKTMECYAEHKRRIFAKQSPKEYAVAPIHDERLHTKGSAQQLWIDAFPGAKVENNSIVLQGTPTEGSISLENNPIFGAHNEQNLMAALLLCSTVGIAPQTLTLSKLKPLAHRLEHIPSTDGLCWINDSKATNVEATMAGIAGAPAPQILLLGGEGKEGADYTALLPLIAQKVHTVICFGAERDIIQAQLPTAISCVSLDEAFLKARSIAQTGDSILLSPACASFDAFSNFVERGLYFASLVRGVPHE